MTRVLAFPPTSSHPHNPIHANVNDQRQQGGDKAPATLVHCLVGQSRSAAAVLAHLILPTTQTTPSLVAAHARLAARRPALCVNPGFLRQVAWLEDYVRSEATAAEYRVALLWEHGPVLSAAATAAARQGVVGRVDATVAKVTAAVAPFVPSGVGKCGVWRCRQCWFALFTVNDTVRHGHAVGRTAVARMALMAEAAPPAAAAFWGYAREFGARPLMHVRGAGKAKAGRGQKGSKGGKGVGDDGNAEKEIDADAECPWVYTQPPKWALPALLLDQGGSGAGAAVVSLHCPGRHCGRAVGVAAPLANVNALTACECGSPTPWVVARFQRRVVVLEAEVEEGVGGTGAGGV